MIFRWCITLLILKNMSVRKEKDPDDEEQDDENETETDAEATDDASGTEAAAS